MRTATKTVAISFGMLAGLAGLEHGYFEILQGNTRPAAWMFPSMGPPCVAEEIWHAVMDMAQVLEIVKPLTQ